MGAMPDPNSTGPGGGVSGLTPDQQAALAAAVISAPSPTQPMDSVLQSLLTPLYRSQNPELSPEDDARLSALFGSAPGSAQPTGDPLQSLGGSTYPSAGDQIRLNFGGGGIGPPGLAPEHAAALTALLGGSPLSPNADPFRSFGGPPDQSGAPAGPNDGLVDAMMAAGSPGSAGVSPTLYKASWGGGSNGLDGGGLGAGPTSSPQAYPNDGVYDLSQADAGSLQQVAGRLHPWVTDFRNAHLADAIQLAKAIGHGATPDEVLAVSGEENIYGKDPLAKIHGNYFGLHSKGTDPSQYFPGQISYLPSAQDGPLATFDPGRGFYNSGSRFASAMRGAAGKADLSDPSVFFSLAHGHGWGKTNPQYLRDVQDVYKNLRQSALAVEKHP